MRRPKLCISIVISTLELMHVYSLTPRPVHNTQGFLNNERGHIFMNHYLLHLLYTLQYIEPWSIYRKAKVFHLICFVSCCWVMFVTSSGKILIFSSSNQNRLNESQKCNLVLATSWTCWLNQLCLQAFYKCLDFCWNFGHTSNSGASDMGQLLSYSLADTKNLDRENLWWCWWW